MKKYLQTAQEMNLMVVFVLWNGADTIQPNAVKMLQNTDNWWSYIKNALTPMVQQLAD